MTRSNCWKFVALILATSLVAGSASCWSGSSNGTGSSQSGDVLGVDGSGGMSDSEGTSNGIEINWELSEEPALPVGYNCNEDDDCKSGYCYETSDKVLDVCSECAKDSDCPADQRCDIPFDKTLFDADWAVCRGNADLGAQCSSDTDCESNICNKSNGSPGVCSECKKDDDCPLGGSCVEDSGKFICKRGLGEDCSSASDCNSDYCIESGINSGCAKCEEDSDCGEKRECSATSPGGPYHSCQGSGFNTASCSSDDQCESGFCHTEGGGSGRCVECEEDSDCGYGSRCIDTSTGDSPYLECYGGRGASCSDDSDCHPEFVCFKQAGTVTERCSECNGSSDCPNGTCKYSTRNGYAMCEEG